MVEEDKPNVLVVLVGGARASNVPLYGYQRNTTPNLVDFAEGATVYHHARAAGNWTLPSAVSILTGHTARQHGFTVDDKLRRGATLFEKLSTEGYETGVFAECDYLTEHESGIDEAFDVSEATADSDETVDSFIEWVADARTEWSALVSLDDARFPFSPAREHDAWGDSEARDIAAELGDGTLEESVYFGDEPAWKLSAVEELYDGSLKTTDAAFGTMVDRLRLGDEFEDTLVVVCSESGIGLGELPHSPWEPRTVGSQISMNESNLHVPLVVKAPKQTSPRTVEAPVSLSDLPKAVMRLRGTRADEGAFVTEEPVVASKCLPERSVAEAISRHEGDVDLDAEASAAYFSSPIPGAVRRYDFWGEDAATMTVHRNSSVTDFAPSEPDFVEKFLHERRSSPDAEPRPGASTPVEEVVSPTSGN